MNKTLEKKIILLLNIILSTFLIYGVELYYKTKNTLYLILTIFSANMLIYILYKMFVNKYSLLQVSLTGKIYPLVILSFLSLFIVKDEPITKKNILALFVVLAGAVVLV